MWTFRVRYIAGVFLGMLPLGVWGPSYGPCRYIRTHWQMPGKQMVPSGKPWAFVSVIPLGAELWFLCMDSRANLSLKLSRSSSQGAAPLTNPSHFCLSPAPACMEDGGNDLCVVSSSDRCTPSWLPPFPWLIGSLSFPLCNRELSESMTLQTI